MTLALIEAGTAKTGTGLVRSTKAGLAPQFNGITPHPLSPRKNVMVEQRLADELRPCWTCRHRTFCEITHSSQESDGQLYRCVNCKAIYPEPALRATLSQPPPDVEELVGRLLTCAEQSEMGKNFAGTPQACRQAANALTALSPGWRDAVMAVVDAIRDYLPPDGIGADECLNRIIGATDNPTITPLILAYEKSLPPAPDGGA